MTFADRYLEKQRLYPEYINEEVCEDLNLIVTIPCFDEPDIIKSLESLWNCKRTSCAVEIIVVVNSGEKTSKAILEQNLRTIKDINVWIKSHKDERMRFFVLHQTNLPKKFAGVGLARKIAMDEAITRFNKINNPNGIIAGFDADALCDTNYLTEIEKLFTKNIRANGANIYYEHPIEGEEFDPKIYRAITQYELYLRYYVQAMRYVGHPNAFITIGSCFTVRASAYIKQGGMNKRQAGEDFYFIQKIISLGNFHEINTTRIIPSPRISDRVPFGTGRVIETFLNENITDYKTYNYIAFKDLKQFFDRVTDLYKADYNIFNRVITELPKSIQSFLDEDNFIEVVDEINRNCASLKSFRKRFFAKFSAFKVLKYLNYVHGKFVNEESIVINANLLLRDLEIIKQNINDTKKLLELYRNLERPVIK